MPSEWAAKQRQRLDRPQTTNEWLVEKKPIPYANNYFVPRYILIAFPFLIFILGPSSLGYIILFAFCYLLYTQFYVLGKTPSSLWEEYQQVAEQHQHDKKQKGRRKNKVKK